MSLMQCSTPIVHDAARVRPEKSEVMCLVSDNRKAERLLQWRPGTELDDGLRQTIDFVAANPGLYAPDRYTI
jgi:nucleoside-diphosphate-sugar epimerase